MTTQSDGSCGVYRFSGVVWNDTSMGVALYGDEGTLIYDLLRDEIRGGKRGAGSLEPIPIPDSKRASWRVESDFIAAIRGERPVTRTDFTTGVRYMQFTEAVARSSRHQVPVTLPLREFRTRACNGGSSRCGGFRWAPRDQLLAPLAASAHLERPITFP